MIRVPSGTTDQYLYFAAYDAVDFTTLKTGLSSFTVYRARNGGSATAFTTPTVAEVSSANMPGIYSLLLDEDMTITSGNEEEEMVFRITASGMAPVSMKISLFDPAGWLVESGVTMRNLARLLAATAGGKVSGAGTTTIVFRDIGDTKNVLSVTVDADGNRSAFGTRDLT